jgi:Xaa-Pro aminopeptidase
MLAPEPPRGFSATEYQGRVQKAQCAMEAAGLDGILLLSEAELLYFTGFQTLFWQSPTRPWFLFLPRQGDPIAIIPEIGAALMRQTGLRDIRTWSAPTPKDDGLSLLQELLGPFAAQKAQIGLLKGPETGLRMPLGDYERLIASLPGLKIIDATPIIRGLRMIKSPAEIAKLSYICAIGSASFDAVPSFATQGQPLSTVFRDFRREALLLGADDVPYLVGGADQGGYIDVISPPTTRPLQRGDILMLDTGARFDGYFCDFDRNFAIGMADDASRRAYGVLHQAVEAGLETARPGATCREVFAAMGKVIATLDQSGGDVGRAGHGLGLQLTEWPSFAGFDDTVLAENMVLTLEPSLSYGDGRMMVHEENIVIEAKGARLLSKRAPAEIPVI